MNKWLIITLIIGIPLALFIAWIDFLLIGFYSFKQYIITCALEYSIFVMGFFIGYLIFKIESYKNPAKRNFPKKKPKS